DHIFRQSHQDNVKIAITEGRYDPESPGYALNQMLSSLNGVEGGKTTDSESRVASPPPVSPLSKHAGGFNPPSGGGGEMEKSLMQQLYGVGHGISSYPSGVATANPFLHPAMFSATGK
ncbi:Uncharacterized protein FKW44_017337, partial [Caligus rogercresseyi]